MVSLDYIVWIELAPIITVSPTQYDIWIRLIDGLSVKWNKEPYREAEAKGILSDLRDRIQEAIKF
jgi:ArsR family metal-binding transcriptional regulator